MDKKRHFGKLTGYTAAVMLLLPLPLYLLFRESVTTNTATTAALPSQIHTEARAQEPGIPSTTQNATSEPTHTPRNTDSTFSITIPKINLAHTIAPNIDPSDQEEYQPILERYVAHGAHTAVPSALYGNTYLFAHSRRMTGPETPDGGWFTRIDELERGDSIAINYHGTLYPYTVMESFVVDPKETSVYRTYTAYPDHRSLTLQTCYPRGGTAQRLIVLAIGD